MQNLDVTRRRFLLGIFVVSGFTGLIYESIWSQYLKLFLGHAAYAQTVVLAIFMGGMALGSWLVSRYSARLRQLLSRLRLRGSSSGRRCAPSLIESACSHSATCNRD